MNLDAFADTCILDNLSEKNKAAHLAFFFLKTEDVAEFDAPMVTAWIRELGYPAPNVSRLNSKLSTATEIVRAPKLGFYRLHRTFQKKMEAEFPKVSRKSQTVDDLGTVLPEILYSGTRGFLESLAKQINASFEHNIFDGCAVLMRRLEEILLILTYEKLQIESQIKDPSGNYQMLEKIVKDAIGNQDVSLSRNSKKTVEKIRELGNFSAHKITYTCKKEYIEEVLLEFRAMVDELLHKAGIRI